MNDERFEPETAMLSVHLFNKAEARKSSLRRLVSNCTTGANLPQTLDRNPLRNALNMAIEISPSILSSISPTSQECIRRLQGHQAEDVDLFVGTSHLHTVFIY